MPQRLEPTNSELALRLAALEAKLDILIEAAKEGGGIAPSIDYGHLHHLRVKVKRLQHCQKECIAGPCRYGGAQALQCLELFEKLEKVRVRRAFFAKHAPYTREQLERLRRTDLVMLTGIMRIPLKKILTGTKGLGNAPLVVAILKKQPRFVAWRDARRAEKEAAKQQKQAEPSPP
jgi:hypothetical protein